jgi:hypothetical protein
MIQRRTKIVTFSKSGFGDTGLRRYVSFTVLTEKALQTTGRADFIGKMAHTQ